MRDLSLIDIDAILLVYLLMRVIANFQRYTGYLNFIKDPIKVSKGAKIRYRYNQVPHLTQDTNGKVTSSQVYSTNDSQEVSPFPVGDHKAQIKRRAQRHNKHKTEKNIKIHKRSTALERLVKYFKW